MKSCNVLSVLVAGLGACAAVEEKEPTVVGLEPLDPTEVGADVVADGEARPLEGPTETQPVEARAEPTELAVAASPAVGRAIVPTATRVTVPKRPETQLASFRPYGLTQQEIGIWNDPAFKKRFADSYIAETEIEPRVTLDEREDMQEVLDLISADRMDRALDLLKKRGGPVASAVFDFTEANIHFQAEELDLAVAAYERAVDKYPKFRRAWGNLGQVHFRQGDFEAALPALTRVISLGGGDAILYGMLGIAYTNTEDHLAAESAYRMASLLDPASLDWKMGMAYSFFQQRRFPEAVALFGRLIDENPDNAELWLFQANAYIGLGERMRAAENFELADRLGGSSVESLNTLGDIYVMEELYDLAVASYVRALDQTANGDVSHAMGAAKALVGRGATAETETIVEYLEANFGATLDEDDRRDLLRMRARLALAKGAGDEEARILEELVELDPLDGDALIQLGWHASRSDQPEKAAFYFERAAGIEEFEAAAKVAHGQLLVGQRKFAEALPLLRRAQKLKYRENVQEYLDEVERVSQGR